MIPVREFTEIPMRELTETELDAVCGGLFNFGSIASIVQANTAVNVGLAFGGSVAQLIGQSNIAAVI
jgi:hypothetical protein